MNVTAGSLPLPAADDPVRLAKQQVANFCAECERALIGIAAADSDLRPVNGPVSLNPSFGPLSLSYSWQCGYGSTVAVHVVLPEAIENDGITHDAGSRVELDHHAVLVDDDQLLFCGALGSELRDAKARLLAELAGKETAREQREGTRENDRLIGEANDRGRQLWLAEQVNESQLA